MVYVSLADFAATFHHHDDDAIPGWAWRESTRTTPLLDDTRVRRRIEDLIDTVVALQRADRLEDGVYLGPRTLGGPYRELLDAARVLRVAVPPATVSGIAPSSQAVLGTDHRAWLHLSSFFLRGADEGERRFLLGRLCGHIAARHVTWLTVYALLVDQGGIRQVARRAVGPTLEIVLAPASLGLRLALSRWHRAAEVSADRAGLLVAGDLDAAGQALLRMALGVRPDLDPDDYLARLRAARERNSPGRWTEVLQSRPWLHKRLEALALFARSEPWVEAGHEPIGDGPVLDADALDRLTAALMQVGT